MAAKKSVKRSPPAKIRKAPHRKGPPPRDPGRRKRSPPRRPPRRSFP